MHIPSGCVGTISYSLQSIGKIIYNQYRRDLQDDIRLLCQYKGVKILEGYVMPDHVHLLVSISPKLSVASFMGYLKGKSALMMSD